MIGVLLCSVGWHRLRLREYMLPSFRGLPVESVVGVVCSRPGCSYAIRVVG